MPPWKPSAALPWPSRPSPAARWASSTAPSSAAPTPPSSSPGPPPGKGQPQVVRVERVTVEAGGQAIVGAVNQGGGGGYQENEDRAHAPGSIAHEPEPTLRCPDAQREAMPVPG